MPNQNQYPILTGRPEKFWGRPEYLKGVSRSDNDQLLLWKQDLYRAKMVIALEVKMINSFFGNSTYTVQKWS